MSSKRDLLTDPAWRSEDLGIPIPESPHAVSVCLPTWADVVGYEEGEERVVRAMKAGYPRFFRPLAVRKWEEELCGTREGNACLVFPNEKPAKRCRRFIEDRHDGWPVEIEDAGDSAVAVIFSREVAGTASKYWRFCGEGVSSRQAECHLKGGTKAGTGEASLATIRERVAHYNGQDPEDVYLFPSGMAGVAALHRALTRVFPGARTAQLDFPYVDVLKVQEHFGSGAWFEPAADSSAVERLAALSGAEQLAGVFCEIASNPLLRTPNLAAVKRAAEKGDAPLVIDDTVATSIDVEAARYADVITTSLTKAFSGGGDVLAGAVTLCRDSRFHARLKEALELESDCMLWSGDAEILVGRSADYESRVRRSGETGQELARWLRKRSGVAKVHYPEATDEAYGLVKRDDCGYGTLFSLELEDPERQAPRFHNALRVSKGPSLGNSFTLACAYTLLAHYEELDWADKCGVSRWLIRVSVGLEGVEDLKSRFEDALKA